MAETPRPAWLCDSAQAVRLLNHRHHQIQKSGSGCSNVIISHTGDLWHWEYWLIGGELPHRKENISLTRIIHRSKSHEILKPWCYFSTWYSYVLLSPQWYFFSFHIYDKFLKGIFSCFFLIMTWPMPRYF